MTGRSYRIGDVAKMLGVATSKLRFWESEILYLRPHRTDKGQRYYFEKDIELLKRIQQLLDQEKLTIPGAIQALKKERYGKPLPDVQEAEDTSSVQISSDPISSDQVFLDPASLERMEKQEKTLRLVQEELMQLSDSLKSQI